MPPGGAAPFNEGAPPESHYLNMLGTLRAAGLENTGVETLVHSVDAPLQEDVVAALAALF